MSLFKLKDYSCKILIRKVTSEAKVLPVILYYIEFHIYTSRTTSHVTSVEEYRPLLHVHIKSPM